MLTNVNGTVDIDDCRFSTSGHLTVYGGTYTFADGSAFYFAASAYGLSAGDTVSIGDLWSDPSAAKVYRVSDDGTQIIRDEDGTVVYEGDPSTLADMNIGPITFADYYGGQIASGVQTFITKYISFDGDKLIVKADKLQSDIKAGIEGYRNELEGADVDVAVQYLSNTVANILGINVSFDYLLSQDALNRLKNNISVKMQDTDNAADAVIADLDDYAGGDGLKNWLTDKILAPLQEQLGMKDFAAGMASVVDSDSTLHLSRWLDMAKPLLADQFSNPYTSKVLAANLDAVGNAVVNKIRGDAGTVDGHADIIFDGDTSDSIGIFLTPFDSLQSTVGNIIDASDSSIDNWIFSVTKGDTVIGSDKNDTLYVDDADVVSTNGGNDLIVLTGDETSQLIAVDTEGSDTVIGFDYDVDALNIDQNEFFKLHVKIDFDDQGLTVFDGDGSMFMPVADFDTVSANILVDDQHVTAVNKNQSLDATGADRYMLCGNATLTNFTGAAIVNDVSISASSPISLVSLERENRGNRIVNGIFGVQPNDTIQLANSDGNNPITYIVNADGTEIIRNDTGRTVWTGTAEEFAELDFLTVDYQEYYGGIFTAHVEALLDQYVTFDNGTVTVDRKAFRENLDIRIERLTAQLDSDSTVDDALGILVNDLNALFDVDLTETFSDKVVGAIRTQISNALENGDNPFSAAFGILTSLLSTVANAFWDSSARLGVQTFAADEANIFSGNGSVIENLGLDTLLQDLFNTRSARRMVHYVVTDYRDRFIDEFEDGRLNFIIQSADDTVNRVFYLGAPDPTLIDTVEGGINIIMNSFDGSEAQYLFGTDGDDYFHVGDNDTVDSGAGNDAIIFADGDTSINATINFNSANPLEITSAQFTDRHTRQTVVLDTDTTATVIGFETGFDDESDVLSVAGGDAVDLKFDFTDKGLLVHNTGNSWDFDGTLLLATDDSGVLPTVNPNAVSDSRTPQPSVDADLLISDRKARIYVGNRAFTLDNSVDINYITDNSTVNADSAANIINGGNNVLINASDDADTVYSNYDIGTVGGYETLNAGAGNDFLESGGGFNLFINGDDGNDVIFNWASQYSTVNGGAGDDFVALSDGSNEYAALGDGNDFIQADNETDATIDGGAGNDYIYLINGGSHLILQSEGNDTVTGLTANDTIMIGGGTTMASGNDIIVENEGGTMLLRNAAALESINIVGMQDTAVNNDTLIAAGLVEYTQHKIDSLSAPSLAAEYFHNDYDYDWQPSLSVGSETWTIQSADELALNAVHYEPAESTGKWVVLVHGYGGNHTTMREFVDNYLAVGYDVLAIDQRAAGESEGEWLTMGAAEAQDVALWTQEIARRVPTSKITLHGVSMGAATVMLAAARSDCANLMAVVEDCGYASAYDLFSQLVPVLTPYPATIMPVMDMMSSLMTGHALTEATPLDVIDDVTVPSMFIHGTADTLIAPSNADSLYAASGAEVKTLYNVEGAGHGRSGIDYNEEYGANLFQFLDNNDGSGVIYGYLSNMTVGGTDDADSIINVGTENTINAFDGDDWITLGGTSWTVEGDQTLQSTGNNIVVNAGAGNDTVRSNHSYWSTIDGGDGNDFVNISDGHYMNINAGAGDDSIIGTRINWGLGGHATLDGGDGNDLIRAGYSNDSTINGGAGNDTILVDGPNVTIDGGDGNDVVSLNADTDRTPLGSTDNVVIARANTTIYGLDGDDLLLFADGRRDKSIYFTANGIEFHTDTVMSPDADYVSVLLPDHTDTAVMKLQYSLDGGAITCAFINGRATYSVAEDGFADEYVEVSDYGAVDFTSITSDINITLDNQANIDDPIKFANINTIISGNGLNTITMSDKAGVIVANSGSITINNFKTGSAGDTDRLIFADGLTDKVVDFTADGLSFYTNTVMSPDVDPVNVLLSGITSTTLINLSYDNADTSVFIKEGDTYAASLGQADRYVAITNHGGVDFTGVSDALDITLGNNYLNIDTLIGGEGSTNVLGTSADETFIIGDGKTTVNVNGGNDRIIGLKDGDYIIIDSNIIGSSAVDNNLILTTSDGSVSLTGDSLKGGNSILLSQGHTIIGDSGLNGIYTSDDGATIDAPNSQVTLDSYTYTIAGDDDGVSISGNSLSGVDAASTITFGNAGDYYVNGGLVTVEAGGTLRETDMLSGDTMAVDGGEWFLGSSEYGTLIATDARALIHSNSSDLTIVTGANTTMDPHAGLTVVDYDPTTNSGFSLNGGDPTFGDGVIGLGEGNTVSGLSSNAAKLYYDSDTTLTAWTGSDGLLDRSASTLGGEYLIANVDGATVISGSGNDTIDVSAAQGAKVRYGDGRDTVIGFNDDVLYQDAYSDKKVTIDGKGVRFFDKSDSIVLNGVTGSTEVTWQFGADETVKAAYIVDGEDYAVNEIADEYVGLTTSLPLMTISISIPI